MAANSKLDLPGSFQAGKNYLIKGEDMLGWIKALKADRAVPGAGMKESQTAEGRIFSVTLKEGTSESEGGDFCSLIQDGTTWSIRGGPVLAGIKNFNVPNMEFVTTANVEWLVYVDVNVEVNRDQDGDYFLPGIKTSSNTSQVMDTTTSGDYPSSNAPSASTGVGKIVLPVGVLKITGGVPDFSPTGCGGFRINHCGGNLTYSRI